MRAFRAPLPRCNFPPLATCEFPSDDLLLVDLCAFTAMLPSALYLRPSPQVPVGVLD
jgi:hypothetical protein